MIKSIKRDTKYGLTLNRDKTQYQVGLYQCCFCSDKNYISFNFFLNFIRQE